MWLQNGYIERFLCSHGLTAYRPSSCMATSACLLGYRWLYVSIVNGYDMIIIALAKERRIVFPRTKLELTPTEQQLRKKIDSMLENDIDYFKRIIEKERKPSLNFTWTYVSKLSMIGKNLFINECDPYKESFFCYMLDEYKKIHSSCTNRKSSMQRAMLPFARKHIISIL